MRFCTTCGRNFEGDLPECPHDGTPLFDMGGPTKEPLLAEASEPWSAETPDESVEFESAGVSSDFGVDDSVESRSKEFPNPVATENMEADLAILESGAPVVDLESALFDDEPESSIDIASGIDDLLGDDGSDEIASEAVNLQETDAPIIDDALKPIQPAKSGGGGKLLPILLVLIILGVAGFYFVGGGKEMLSGPEPSVEKKTPAKKVKIIKPVKIIKKEVPQPPLEEPKVEEKAEEETELKPIEGAVDKKEKKTDEKETSPIKKTPKKKPVVKKRVVKKPIVKKPVVKKPVKKVVKKVEKKVEKKPPVEKVTPKKDVKPPKVDDPEELLRKELEAMEGGG